MSALLVITNCPDRPAAEQLAHALVDTGLAACVNILSPCHSIYRWQGAVETAAETPLLIKTHTARYAEVETLIRNRHPYDLPEIIALPITTGLPAYLDWLAAETGTTS